MDLNKILNSFNIFDNSGDIEKFHHLLESKFENYEVIISRNIGSFKYPNWIKEKVTRTQDNSIYLIDEDNNYKLIYDKGIKMFKLTLKKGLLVSESISLSTEFIKNKEDLSRVIKLLIYKLNEPSRNSCSSF